MSADLAVQKAIGARLVGTPAVVALVPAASILDTNERPAPEPSIILGESQLVDEGTDLKRRRVRIYCTIHVWIKETALVGVKAICGAIRTAIQSERLILGAGFHAVDNYVPTMRYLRDSEGGRSHGIVTVEVLVQEMPS